MENILNDVPRAATDKSKGKKRAEKIGVTAVKYLLLAAFSIFFIFPFVIMICYSFLTDSESLQQVLISPSRTFYVGAYIRILQNTKYLGYLKNSVITSVLAARFLPRFALTGLQSSNLREKIRCSESCSPR